MSAKNPNAKWGWNWQDGQKVARQRDHSGHFLPSHNRRRDSLYGIWSKIKGRCLNPSDEAYGSYGKRGITICDRWLDFERFVVDMGERPSRKHQIDRIDNDKGYFPENCRWATSQQQNNNRRGNHRLEISGETHTMAEWSRISGIEQGTIYARWKSGKSGIEIIAPLQRKRRQ